MAKKAPYSNEADYVVVGSGSSGATIAGRLAQSGAKVIVLEAGKTDEKFLTKKPGMIGPMHAVPEIKKLNDWGYYSVPQKHILDRKMPVPRGKVLGGSSSVNGMVYVRGNRANYDSWAAEGCTGWDADTVNAAYKRNPGHGQQDPAGGIAAVPAGDRGRHRLRDPRRLQRRLPGGRRADAAERRRRPALLLGPRLHPPSRPADPRGPDPGARHQGDHRERACHRCPGPRQGRLRAHHPGGQGGHPGRRVRGLRPDPDALWRRSRPAPEGPRHRGRLRPPGRRQPARPHVPRDDLPRDHLEDARQRVVLRQGRGQGGRPSRLDLPGQLGLRGPGLPQDQPGDEQRTRTSRSVTTSTRGRR